MHSTIPFRRITREREINPALPLLLPHAEKAASHPPRAMASSVRAAAFSRMASVATEHIV